MWTSTCRFRKVNWLRNRQRGRREGMRRRQNGQEEVDEEEEMERGQLSHINAFFERSVMSHLSRSLSKFSIVCVVTY